RRREISDRTVRHRPHPTAAGMDTEIRFRVAGEDDMNDAVIFDLAAIDRLRKNLHADDPAVKQLRTDADAALKTGPFSVTYAERLAAVKDPDPHDYRSFGAYWWPNPNTPDGLPYIVRDGVGNPDALKGNYDDMQTMSHGVQQLAMAYRLFGDEAYA